MDVMLEPGDIFLTRGPGLFSWLKYDTLKLAAHLLDWLLLGVYLFRRLADNGDYPICSWLVAHAFGEAGKNFGVERGAAEPDDIWDFVTAKTDKYECLHPLARLREDEAAPEMRDPEGLAVLSK